ncbi:MAG: DUF4199 domain-containing protein [Spirosomataceae bacterium]
MQKTIIRFGLISGIISSILMVIVSFIGKAVGFQTFADYGAYIGFTCIILSLTLVFVGIKNYRDQQNDGTISFGKAFQIGILITLISCVCYALTWVVCYFNLFPTFFEDYSAYYLQKLQEGGASAAEIAKQTAEMKRTNELYQNPLYNFGITFMEPFPVGLLMTVVAAWVLKKK